MSELVSHNLQTKKYSLIFYLFSLRSIFAGLWPKGFKELSVNAIAHTSSGNSQAVAQEMLVQGSVTIVHREIAQVKLKESQIFHVTKTSIFISDYGKGR